MAKTKILITIDWYLPGTNSGGPVRSIANMVAHLKDVNFYIITRNTDYCSDEVYANVQSNAWNKLADNVQVYYFSADQLTKQKLTAVMQSAKADVVYINGVYSKFFSIAPLKIARELQHKTIVAARGMLSPHALQVKKLKKQLFLRWVNSKKAYKEVVFHATQEAEKADIAKVIKQYKSISVIPNFPRAVDTTENKAIIKQAGEVRFISLGRIAEEKGTLVSLAALQHCTGNVVVDLYGTIYSESYWEKCQALINSLPENIKVTYKGTLPADQVIDTLQGYHFLLLPSKGENYGHSIVESFMAQRSVIISKHTPWKDLAAKNIGFDVAENELPQTIQNAIDMNNTEYTNITQSINQQLPTLLKVNELNDKYEALFHHK